MVDLQALKLVSHPCSLRALSISLIFSEFAYWKVGDPEELVTEQEADCHRLVQPALDT